MGPSGHSPSLVPQGPVVDQQSLTVHVKIRKAKHSDMQAVSGLAKAAFGAVEGPDIVQLIADILNDGSAQPVLSLVATAGKGVVGHILFSKARVNQSGMDVSASILAPLAVEPEYQAQGIGSQLVTEGLRQLAVIGVDLVFVLGHPDYYPRYGFNEAGINGFEAPYPIPQKDAGAWMVQELHTGVIGRSSGRVVCADALSDPKYWHE